jgi:hypothetical protein
MVGASCKCRWFLDSGKFLGKLCNAPFRRGADYVIDCAYVIPRESLIVTQGSCRCNLGLHKPFLVFDQPHEFSFKLKYHRDDQVDCAELQRMCELV